MVWIHGGGYTLGSKVLYSPSAAGLLLESQSNGGEGIIWVGLNYRLGIFVRFAVSTRLGDFLIKNADSIPCQGVSVRSDFSK